MEINDHLGLFGALNPVLYAETCVVGYSFELIDNLFVIPVVCVGLSGVNMYFFGDSRINILGLAIPIGAYVKYFFTDLIGIEAEITNYFNIPLLNRGVTKFMNTFTIKIGPSFRFGGK